MLSFSGEPVSTALLDVDAVAAELAATSAADLALLGRLIAAVSTRLALACARRHFGRVGVTQTDYAALPSGRNQHHRREMPVWLKHWPVTTLTSVTLDDVLLDTDDYQLDDRRALWRMDGTGYRCGWNGGKLVTVYDGGYDLPSGAPADLADLAMELVRGGWHSAQRDPMIRAQDIPGVLSTQFWVGTPSDLVGGLTEVQASVLDNYRNHTFG